MIGLQREEAGSEASILHTDAEVITSLWASEGAVSLHIVKKNPTSILILELMRNRITIQT